MYKELARCFKKSAMENLYSRGYTFWKYGNLVCPFHVPCADVLVDA